MKTKNIIYRMLIFLLITILTVALGYLYLTNVVFVLSNETIEIIKQGTGTEWEKEKTEIFYQELTSVDKKIAVANFFAKHGSNIGYKFLSDTIDNLLFLGTTENTVGSAYEALGYMSKFDQRAANILISQFNPYADPTQAITILRALFLSENPRVICQVKEEALKDLGDTLSNEERKTLLSYSINK